MPFLRISPSTTSLPPLLALPLIHLNIVSSFVATAKFMSCIYIVFDKGLLCNWWDILSLDLYRIPTGGR